VDNNNNNNNNSKASKSYRDEKFYISTEPPSQEDVGYSVRDGELNRLDDMVIGLMGDDAQSLLKTRRIEKWDRKKKKFMISTVGGDPFKNLRNEAGQKIYDKHNKNPNQPSIYEKWQKKSKRSVNDNKTAEPVDGGDNEQDDNDSNNNNRKKKAMMTSDWRRSKPKGSTNNNNSGDIGRQGKPFKTEIRTPDEIRKQRILKERNKIKNRPGGFRAHKQQMVKQGKGNGAASGPNKTVKSGRWDKQRSTRQTKNR